MSKVKNTATGICYPFEKGAKEEAQLFRVMPPGGRDKLYFDTFTEYEHWCETTHRNFNTIEGIHKQIE